MRFILLSAAVLLASNAAWAQAPVYDPDQLPAFHGKVASYSLTARDEVDGVVLDDGTEIHLSARLSSELTFAIKPGDAVTVHGLKASSAPMVQALSIANDASGTKITDAFQPSSPADRPQFVQPRMMEARGRVKMLLHTTDGRVDGVLLEDGTIIRLAGGYNPQNPDCLVVGKDVVATGTGLASLLGRVMETRQIAVDNETSVPGTPGRTVVILPGGMPQNPGQHLPLFNAPASGNPPAQQH
jgi:hypothetical protein